MASHGDGREEIAGAILHIDTLQGIGIIAHPELIEVTKHSPVGTSATTGAALYHHILVFGTYAVYHLAEPLMIGYVEMTLVCHGEILAAMIHDAHIGIPLDISYLGILAEQVVDDTEGIVLHLRVGEIENELRATTTQHRITFGSLDNPVGMLLIKFAGSIGHLGFYPDTKLHTVLLGITQEALDTVWEFLPVNLPVAKSTVVTVALILGAEPSVVHHKQLTTHRGDVCHHLIHTLLVDVEIDTLPGIEQNITKL